MSEFKKESALPPNAPAAFPDGQVTSAPNYRLLRAILNHPSETVDDIAFRIGKPADYVRDAVLKNSGILTLEGDTIVIIKNDHTTAIRESLSKALGDPVEYISRGLRRAADQS